MHAQAIQHTVVLNTDYGTLQYTTTNCHALNITNKQC